MIDLVVGEGGSLTKAADPGGPQGPASLVNPGRRCCSRHSATPHSGRFPFMGRKLSHTTAWSRAARTPPSGPPEPVLRPAAHLPAAGISAALGCEGGKAGNWTVPMVRGELQQGGCERRQLGCRQPSTRGHGDRQW